MLVLLVALLGVGLPAHADGAPTGSTHHYDRTLRGYDGAANLAQVGHYGLETGPQRNIPGSVVDEAIDQYPGMAVDGGKTVHYDPNNNVIVVTGRGGSIVSAHRVSRASRR